MYVGIIGQFFLFSIMILFCASPLSSIVKSPRPRTKHLKGLLGEQQFKWKIRNGTSNRQHNKQRQHSISKTFGHLNTDLTFQVNSNRTFANFAGPQKKYSLFDLKLRALCTDSFQPLLGLITPCLCKLVFDSLM
jgi:hypothetical protein